MSTDADALLRGSTDELLDWLERATTPSEAGRVAIRLIGALIPAPPARRWTLAELPGEAKRVLGAIARSELAATSGDLTLVLDGCGLPRERRALARFVGDDPPTPEELPVALDGRAVPLWKLVDAVVHDGVPLERAAEALATTDAEAVARGLHALVRAHHVAITRIQQPNAPIDPVRDEEDFRRNARTIAALAPDATLASLEAEASTARDPRAATVVVLRRGARAQDEHLSAVLAGGPRYAPLLTDIVGALPAERREALVLAAVPPPHSAYAEPTDLQLHWLMSTPTPRTATRLLDFARAWRRRRSGVPWDALAAAVRRMGEPGLVAVEAARSELPGAFIQALFGVKKKPRTRRS